MQCVGTVNKGKRQIRLTDKTGTFIPYGNGRLCLSPTTRPKRAGRFNHKIEDKVEFLLVKTVRRNLCTIEFQKFC